MKALSAKQASQCENAKHKRCRCRCGGQYHGSGRGGGTPDEPERGFFESLPADDPHNLPVKQATAQPAEAPATPVEELPHPAVARRGKTRTGRYTDAVQQQYILL